MMNELQKRFFEHLAAVQKNNVEVCMTQHRCDDTSTKSMLYEVTYRVITDMMEMVDGYSDFSKSRHDIINTVTGERLKEHPFIELHDQTEDFLRYE